MQGLELELIDLDEVFENLSFEPIILNNVPAQTKAEREALNNLIMTTYDKTDTLQSTPSCNCGELAYGINLGKVCNSCGTRVEHPANRDIEPNVWFEAPENILGLINPVFYLIFSKAISPPQFNVMLWLCNADYKVEKTNKRIEAIINKLQKNEIPRGLNNFIKHFDEILPTLLTLITPRSRREGIRQFILEYRAKLFPKHLPMPNKIAFILENTSTVTYADPTMREAIDAARTISSIDKETKANIKRLEAKMTNVINSLATYYNNMFGKPFSKKYGWLRNTVFGTRMGFAFRSVIVSESGAHNYEEIKVPYAQLVTTMKMHIINYLYKQRLTPRQAWDFVDTYTRNPDKEGVMVSILDQLIKDEIWAVWIRFPTLARASIQAFRITGWLKTAATLPVTATKGCNGDYDGDILSGAVMLTRQQIEGMTLYRPHYDIISYHKLRTFKHNIALPEVVSGILFNWIEDEDYDYLYNGGVDV